MRLPVSSPGFEGKIVVTKRILWLAVAIVAVALAPRVLVVFHPEVPVLRVLDDGAAYVIYILVVSIVVAIAFELLGPSHHAGVIRTDIKPGVSIALRWILVVLIAMLDLSGWGLFVWALNFSSNVLLAVAVFHSIWIALAIIVHRRFRLDWIGSAGIGFMASVGIFAVLSSAYIALNPR